MPRGPRLDAPGSLHHAIVRGIEKRDIVDDNEDRENFRTRMETVAEETGTVIYAWALLSNHAHILLRSGADGIALFMRRLLTGYAVNYNRRHQRHGHLFQNRYKSILCEEDAYFTELVRYIHLNPLRAGLVETLAELDVYPWCGHAVVLAKQKQPAQDRDYVLKWFGGTEGAAKKAYRAFLKQGVPLGHRPELVGGGLIRSLGGWSSVKSQRRDGTEEKGDARILGSSEFVTQMIEEAELHVRKQLPHDDMLEAAGEIIKKRCAEQGVSIEALRGGSRLQAVSGIRKELVLELVHDLGLSQAETGRQLGLTTSGVSQILRRNA